MPNAADHPTPMRPIAHEDRPAISCMMKLESVDDGAAVFADHPDAAIVAAIAQSQRSCEVVTLWAGTDPLPLRWSSQGRSTARWREPTRRGSGRAHRASMAIELGQIDR